MASRPVLVTVGAGPGGVSALLRARELAGDRVHLVLVQEGPVEYHAGVISVALGERTAAEFRAEPQLGGVEWRQARAEAVDERGVLLSGGERLHADAVILAPGVHVAEPSRPGWLGVWSLTDAEQASSVLRELLGAVRQPRIVVLVEALPIRCPPAPYALAMQLAARGAAVTVVTPESAPVAVAGPDVGGLVADRCRAHAVSLELEWRVDPEQGGDQRVVAEDGRTLSADLVLVVPRHIAPPILQGWEVEGIALMGPSAHRVSGPGALWVIGDALRSPLPKAAGVAEAQGRTAAEQALAHLALHRQPGVHFPEPSCFVGEGHGRFSLIRLRYPEGLPPMGRPRAELKGPSQELANDFVRPLEVKPRWLVK